MGQIDKLFTGKPKALSSSQIITSIGRTEVDQLIVQFDKIDNDEVFNKIHHGGLQRVVHHYPLEHYLYFQSIYPHHDFKFGQMGENISTTGLLEKDVCIGDVYEVGKVLLSVTEPRKPCATINYQFSISGLARRVQNESRTGWFYKVLTPGIIKKNDQFALKERPYPKLSIELCVQSLLVKQNSEVLKLMANNPLISDNWKNTAADFLVTGKIPDDRPRLGEA